MIDFDEQVFARLDSIAQYPAFNTVIPDETAVPYVRFYHVGQNSIITDSAWPDIRVLYRIVVATNNRQDSIQEANAIFTGFNNVLLTFPDYSNYWSSIVSFSFLAERVVSTVIWYVYLDLVIKLHRTV